MLGVGRQVGILDVVLEHLFLRLLLCFQVFLLRLLLPLVHLAGCAGVGLGAGGGNGDVRQQETETQHGKSEDGGNSPHRFLRNPDHSTTACNLLFHYGSK